MRSCSCPTYDVTPTRVRALTRAAGVCQYRLAGALSSPNHLWGGQLPQSLSGSSATRRHSRSALGPAGHLPRIADDRFLHRAGASTLEQGEMRVGIQELSQVTTEHPRHLNTPAHGLLKRRRRSPLVTHSVAQKADALASGYNLQNRLVANARRKGILSASWLRGVRENDDSKGSGISAFLRPGEVRASKWRASTGLPEDRRRLQGK